jgi:predicted RNase H-like HicB family nuclease
MQYGVLLSRDPVSDRWIAEVPDFPGCLTEGCTEDKALRNIVDAAHLWVETTRETGKENHNDRYDRPNAAPRVWP